MLDSLPLASSGSEPESLGRVGHLARALHILDINLPRLDAIAPGGGGRRCRGGAGWALHESLDSTLAIHELRLEQHIRVVIHVVFQRNHDKLNIIRG